ncbi:MAG: hypothetical protein M1821_006627 [Bathelium mastoideum]|nr:MAG: hypothetical protein M1821_006627 [Bathelium mastoideum]
MSASGLVSVVAFFSRLPSITQEQFYEEWDKHGSLEIPWLKKHGVLEYTRVRFSQTSSQISLGAGTAYSRFLFIKMRTPDAMRNALEKALDLSPHKPKMLPFDGCAIITCESIEKLLGSFLDPYYAEVIAVDEARFVDAAHTQLQLAGGVPPAGTAGLADKWIVDGKPTIDVTEGEKKLREIEEKHAAK